MLTQLLIGLFLGLSVSRNAPQFALNPCNRDIHSLVDFVECSAHFYMREESIPTLEEYLARSPSESQLEQVIQEMLQGDCPETLPYTLHPHMSTIRWRDSNTSVTYCILSEKHVNLVDRLFIMGWGIFIVPLDRVSSVKKPIHLQAPHPLYDLGTDIQAAITFSKFPFSSLTLSTRHRRACPLLSTCITSTPKSHYYLSDPTHSSAEPFHSMSSAVLSFERKHEKEPIFIQLHAKATTTCISDTAFFSAGIGSSQASKYVSSTDWPVNILRGYLEESSRHLNWSVTTPATSSCYLSATLNIFGRLMNKVMKGKECTAVADSDDVNGHFIHIEQAVEAINSQSIWESALSMFFQHYV